MGKLDLVAVLVCGGEISNYNSAKSKVSQGDFIVAVDSGADHIRNMNLIPKLLIGDFDSISKESLTKFQDVEMLSFPPEKDMTDTELALREVISRGYKTIKLLGAYGDRVDHFLANVHLLELVDKLGATAELISNSFCIKLLTPSNCRAEIFEGTNVSLIPISDLVSGITTYGLKYPLENATINRISSIGVSNEHVLNPKNAWVSITSGKLLVIISD